MGFGAAGVAGLGLGLLGEGGGEREVEEEEGWEGEGCGEMHFWEVVNWGGWVVGGGGG